MKLLVKRLVAKHPAEAAEVAQFCRLTVDLLLEVPDMEVWWETDAKHPADELLLITNDLDANELIELAEYIEGLLLPPAGAMRAAT